jgi:thiaminase
MQDKRVYLKWIRSYQFTEIRKQIKAGKMIIEKLSYFREYY